MKVRYARWAGLVGLILLWMLTFSGIEPGLSQQGSPPEITGAIDFPDEILANGEENQGFIYLKDPDKDIAQISFQLLQPYTSEPLTFDISISGEIGVIAFTISATSPPLELKLCIGQPAQCEDIHISSAAPARVTFRVTAADEAGNESDPREFSFLITGREMADLTVSLTAPSKAQVGEAFEVETVVQNIAGTAAGPFRIGVYLSDDTKITSDDLLLASRNITGLAPGSSSRERFNVTVSEAGDYFIGAIVDDTNQVPESNEGNNIASSHIKVEEKPQAAPPTADFTASPTSGTAPLTVQFTNLSKGDITNYSWDFGDGGTSTERDPRHIYRSSGSYTVSLTVRGPGGEDTTTKPNFITVHLKPQPPIARFTYSPSQPEVGESIKFDASSSSDPDGRIVKYEWSFGDDSSGSGKIVYHSYSSARSFIVALKVTDDDGLTDSINRTVTIKEKPKPPVAKFTYSPSQPEVGQSIRFDASSSYDPDGRIVRYEWSFGDGSHGSGKTVYHTYSSARSYTVGLKVTDDDGLTDFASKTITVREKPNQPPQASFNYSPSYPRVADAVNFNGSGSRDPDGTITKYKWSFGDGSRGQGREVSHRYALQGSYTVKLTVTDNRGGTNMTSRTVRVQPLTSNPWKGSKNIHLIFNCQYAPYNITAFRQAVAVMIDRGEVTGQVRAVTPAYSVVPSGNSYWRDSNIKRWGEGMSFSRRIQTAVALLKSAGFRWEVEPTATRYGRGLIMPNGQVLGEQALMHPNAADDNAANLFGMMIAKWLNMLGIPVRAEPSSINAIWGSVEEGYFDMAIVSWDFGSQGFPQYLYNLFASSQVSPDGLNYSSYESSEYDDVALELLHATSDSQARSYAYKLQEILAEDVPHVVLYERRW